MQEHPLKELPISARGLSEIEVQDVSGLLESAKVLAQDSDLHIFHRFDKLRVFCILRLQRRLAAMTEELEELVASSKNITLGSEAYFLRDKKLSDLVQDIECTLKDYDNSLWAQERIERFREPDGGFLAAFMRNLETKAPLVNNDYNADSAFHLNKLVATPKEAKSWIHRFIDSHSFLSKRFGPKPKDEENSRGMMFYSEVKVRRADQIFMNVAFCLLIICPVIVLSLVDNTVAKLSIVVGFYVLGSILLALGTGSSNPALAVLAAYAAFLVFFIGVGVNSSS